jgi:hypothetical protein
VLHNLEGREKERDYCCKSSRLIRSAYFTNICCFSEVRALLCYNWLLEIKDYDMRIQVLTAAGMKFRSVLWDILPCKIIVDRRFIGTHRPDDGGSMYLWNVGRYSIKNTVVHPRRFWASYSPPWELEISHSYLLLRLGYKSCRGFYCGGNLVLRLLCWQLMVVWLTLSGR